MGVRGWSIAGMQRKGEVLIVFIMKFKLLSFFFGQDEV